jgi:hypothetical protein
MSGSCASRIAEGIRQATLGTTQASATAAGIAYFRKHDRIGEGHALAGPEPALSALRELTGGV